MGRKNASAAGSILGAGGAVGVLVVVETTGFGFVSTSGFGFQPRPKSDLF